MPISSETSKITVSHQLGYEKHVWLLKKLKIELPYDPVTPCPGIYPRELKTHVHTKTYTQAFTAAFFIDKK